MEAWCDILPTDPQTAGAGGPRRNFPGDEMEGENPEVYQPVFRRPEVEWSRQPISLLLQFHGWRNYGGGPPAPEVRLSMDGSFAFLVQSNLTNHIRSTQPTPYANRSKMDSRFHAYI